jgi:DNA mismatch repair protein MutS
MSGRIVSSSGVTQTLSSERQSANSETFSSILFQDPDIARNVEGNQTPGFFADLCLDQIVEAITRGRDEYNLKPFFYTPLRSVEAINYRYEVFRDLEKEALAGFVQSFGQEIRTMRQHLAQAEKLYYKYQKQRWFLDAVGIYCDAIKRLSGNLEALVLQSRGFRAFRRFLASYAESSEFVALAADARKLKAELLSIQYSLHIEGKRIKVGHYEPEPDYGADVLRTFEKFKQGAPKEYRFDFRPSLEMDHVEAAILDLVAQLYPEVFSSLDEYCNNHRDYLNSAIAAFDREVQFYLACLEYAEGIKRAGLPFCYPCVTDQSKEVYGREVFDLALANRLVPEKTSVVTNDFYLRDPERVFAVSGPNQGGKTTFARTFGQLHYLASIGCPVPGREARLFLFDKLFTHFEKAEDIETLRGKLEDELIRIHRILECATPNSILIMNESFLSTTMEDALFLSKEIIQRILDLKMLCVSVTFLDEMASLSEATVSMVSTVDPKDPALRTYKVVRKPADGIAYAVAIAEKYRLTYGSIKAHISEIAQGRNTS